MHKKTKWPIARFSVQEAEGESRVIHLKGRDRWALEKLIEAGPTGLTPREMNGPRVHAYVFDLRHEHGLIIETERETHEGDFPGWHGRYVLKSKVMPLPSEGVQT